MLNFFLGSDVPSGEHTGFAEIPARLVSWEAGDQSGQKALELLSRWGGCLQEHALPAASVWSQARPARPPGLASEGKERLCCGGSLAHTMSGSHFHSEGPWPEQWGPEFLLIGGSVHGALLVYLLTDHLLTGEANNM